MQDLQEEVPLSMSGGCCLIMSLCLCYISCDSSSTLVLHSRVFVEIPLSDMSIILLHVLHCVLSCEDYFP